MSNANNSITCRLAAGYVEFEGVITCGVEDAFKMGGYARSFLQGLRGDEHGGARRLLDDGVVESFGGCGSGDGVVVKRFGLLGGCRHSTCSGSKVGTTCGGRHCCDGNGSLVVGGHDEFCRESVEGVSTGHGSGVDSGRLGGTCGQSESVEDVVTSKVVGKHWKRNKARREKLKKKFVPAWRVGASPLNVKPEVSSSLQEKWVLKNRLDSLRLQEQLKRMELSADLPRSPKPVVVEKVKTKEELALESKARVERLERNIEKTKADTAYWKRRQETGAIEKAIALENEILDGQLSGKYDPFASRRTLGWAKTVKTHGSGSGSGSGSSGSMGKTVWSGSGATTKTDLSVLEQKVAVYEEKLKKSEKDNVELGKKADMLNKQLITVTVESERKDKELFEVKKFKEYLEKAKKEKKRRADNEFETFRTQADCSY